MRVACLYFQEKVETSNIAEFFLRFSPQISVRKDEAIFIEIGKCHRLYSEHGFVLRSQVVLRRLGLNASIGIADTISQSLVQAKYKTQNLAELPLDAIYEYVDPYNVEGRGREQIATMLETFAHLAIKNLREFSDIPNQELVSRFGKSSLICKLRLNNEFPVPWRPWKPQEFISEIRDLTECDPTGGFEPLLFELKILLDRTFARLWSRGLKMASALLILKTEKLSDSIESTREFKFDFISPQSATKGTLGVIKVRLEKDFLTSPLLSPVESVELQVLTHSPGFLSQKNIFHNRDELQESLEALINHLSESHGTENIFYAQPVAERIPEKSWIKSQSPDLIKLELDGIIPERPMYLHEPEPAEVKNGKVYTGSKAFRIKSWSQYAEMISGEWLKDKIDRVYYQVEIDDGPTLWMFEDSSRHYFVHGYFG